MMLKLSDQQISTLFFIAEKSPPVPRDMDRFPNVRMFLREGLVVRSPDRRLVLSSTFPYQEYRQCTRRGLIAENEAASTFDELEQNSKLVFTPESDLTQGHTFEIHDTVMLKKALLALDAHMGDFSKGEETIRMSEDPDKAAAADKLLKEYLDKGY